MVGLIIGLLIIAVVVYITFVEEGGFSAFMAIIIASLVVYIAYSIAAWGYYDPGARNTTTDDAVEVSRDSRSLSALGTNSQVSGSFFLGSGYVDEELVFNYIIQDTINPNAYKLSSIDASNVLVVEDAPDDTGTLVTTKYQRPTNTLWLFNINNVTQTRQEFHVPEGSIVNGYNVDVVN